MGEPAWSAPASTSPTAWSASRRTAKVDPGGAPRLRRPAPLRAHRHRQLPRRHRAPVHRPRPAHLRRRHRPRPHRAVQLPDHRLQAAPQVRKLLVAPKQLKQALLEKIEREIAHQPGGAGLIQWKMNALEDVDIVEALYRASQAGVQIELIVRDTCRLRPGCPASETITVVSIVGRFLEHARIYYFRNGGDEEYFIGSADLMTAQPREPGRGPGADRGSARCARSCRAVRHPARRSAQRLGHAKYEWGPGTNSTWHATASPRRRCSVRRPRAPVRRWSGCKRPGLAVPGPI